MRVLERDAKAGNFLDDMEALRRRIKVLEDTAGIGAASESDLDDHLADLANPHQVTASQAGAVDLTGDTMTGDLAATLVQATWYDYPLVGLDANISSHFRDNDSSFPDGWTEVNAPDELSTTNTVYSFWALAGSSSNALWKYRKQASTNAETVGSGIFYTFGPIFFKDGGYAADVDYYFGIYRDSSGIDEDTFSRVHLQWDSANSQWQIRGERKDSSSGTQTDGSWVVFSTPLSMPIYVSVAVNGDSTKRCFSTVSTAFPIDSNPLQSMTILMNGLPSTALDWGALWVQFHRTRGAGGADRLYIGAADRMI